MREAADRAEHIDLAKLVAVRQALQAALGRLEERPSDHALAAAQEALGQLPVLITDRLWEPLQTAADELEQAIGLDGPTDAAQRQAPIRRLVEDLLANAGSDQPAADVQHVIQAGQASRAIPVVRDQVQVFVSAAEQFAAQPAPPAEDHEARAAWVKAAKMILEKAIDLLTNVAVAAAFTVTAVQLAAERTILGATELAERAVSQIGPELPLLVGITAVAAEAAMGVKLIRDIWQPFDPANRPEAVDRPRRVDPAWYRPADDRREQAARSLFDAINEHRDRLAADQDQPRSERLGPAGRDARELLGLEDDAPRQAETPVGRVAVGPPYERRARAEDDNRDEGDYSDTIERSRRERERASSGIRRHEGPGRDQEPRTNRGRPSRADDDY